MGLSTKLKSIKERFATAARRTLLTTGFLGSGLFFGAQAIPQQTAANDQQKNHITLVIESDTELSEEDKKKINNALLLEAQGNYSSLLVHAVDDQSRDLQALEERLNAELQKDNKGKKIKVLVMDPMDVDVGIALGLNPVDISIRLLNNRNAAYTFQTLWYLADALTGAPYVSAANDETYTQVPMTIKAGQDKKGNEYRILVPLSSYSPLFLLNNLSRTDFVDMVNRHEGWHAIDTKNIFPQKDYEKLNPADLITLKQRLASPAFMALVSWGTNSEAYADLGACADMIRAGSDISIIDAIVEFRLNHNDDWQHMSPPVLWELKNRINDMGIENFRQLDNKAAHKLYKDIIDDAGLNPARLTLAWNYMLCPPNERAAFIEANKSNPDFTVAFNYINCFMFEGYNPGSDVAEHIAAKNAKPAPEMVALIDRVTSWDAASDLTNRAMADHGIITPETLVKAYCAMADEIDNDLKSADHFTQIEAQCKLVKMKNTFQVMVTTIDYVEANKECGVDLLKARPDLEQAYKSDAPVFNVKQVDIKTTPRKPHF